MPTLLYYWYPGTRLLLFSAELHFARSKNLPAARAGKRLPVPRHVPQVQAARALGSASSEAG